MTSDLMHDNRVEMTKPCDLVLVGRKIIIISNCSVLCTEADLIVSHKFLNKMFFSVWWKDITMWSKDVKANLYFVQEDHKPLMKQISTVHNPFLQNPDHLGHHAKHLSCYSLSLKFFDKLTFLNKPSRHQALAFTIGRLHPESP